MSGIRHQSVEIAPQKIATARPRTGIAHLTAAIATQSNVTAPLKSGTAWHATSKLHPLLFFEEGPREGNGLRDGGPRMGGRVLIEPALLRIERAPPRIAKRLGRGDR